MNTRIETDSVGSLNVPEKAYYGISSLRGQINFPITGRRMHPGLIRSLAEVKKAAAMVNRDNGLLDHRIAEAIIEACDEIIAGKLNEQFIVDPIQGGAGTSANMNANEVIANRAIEMLGKEKGDYALVNPNDHVNMSQSTNDVFPTAGKIAVLKLLPELAYELERLEKAFKLKAYEFSDVIKMGRTQLQDAVPIRLGQSFHAYAAVLGRDRQRLQKARGAIKSINLGGTAIGTAINVDQRYLNQITPTLQSVCQVEITQAADLVDATQNLDGFVEVSGIIKTCAVNLSKIANDLRLLSSGPKTGLAEINLPPKQNGSSIMPGKINPVIPEVVSQVAFNIIGNDLTITMAAEAGQLELNAFEPVLFHNLFESLDTLKNAIRTFVDNCVPGITANRERCKELLDCSAGIATALAPYIGYSKAADIAKRSLKTGKSVKSITLAEQLLDQSSLDQILDPVQMTFPGKAAIMPKKPLKPAKFLCNRPFDINKPIC